MLGKSLLVVLTLAVLGMGAIQSAPRPSSGAPLFSILIRAAQSTVKAGSPVEIEIELTNTSSSSIGFQDKGIFPYRIDVRDEAGNKVATTDRGRRLELSQTQQVSTDSTMKNVRLQPGEKMKANCVVSDWYDLSKPGKYVIQLQRGGAHESAMVVKSNSINVSVIP